MIGFGDGGDGKSWTGVGAGTGFCCVDFGVDGAICSLGTDIGLSLGVNKGVSSSHGGNVVVVGGAGVVGGSGEAIGGGSTGRA